MNITGRVAIDPGTGISRLNGILLAVQNSPSPFSAATNAILGQGLQSGNCIIVKGSNGNIGQEQVIFMTGAVPAPGACP